MQGVRVIFLSPDVTNLTLSGVQEVCDPPRRPFLVVSRTFRPSVREAQDPSCGAGSERAALRVGLHQGRLFPLAGCTA